MPSKNGSKAKTRSGAIEIDLVARPNEARESFSTNHAVFGRSPRGLPLITARFVSKRVEVPAFSTELQFLQFKRFADC